MSCEDYQTLLREDGVDAVLKGAKENGHHVEVRESHVLVSGVYPDLGQSFKHYLSCRLQKSSEELKR